MRDPKHGTSDFIGLRPLDGIRILVCAERRSNRVGQKALSAAQPFTRLLGTELTAWSVDEVALRLAVQPAFFQHHGGVIA